jgi:hypothetical protein
MSTRLVRDTVKCEMCYTILSSYLSLVHLSFCALFTLSSARSLHLTLSLLHLHPPPISPAPCSLSSSFPLILHPLSLTRPLSFSPSSITLPPSPHTGSTGLGERSPAWARDHDSVAKVRRHAQRQSIILLRFPLFSTFFCSFSHVLKHYFTWIHILYFCTLIQYFDIPMFRCILHCISFIFLFTLF